MILLNTLYELINPLKLSVSVIIIIIQRLFKKSCRQTSLASDSFQEGNIKKIIQFMLTGIPQVNTCEVRDFIFIIQKVLKKQPGIVRPSERLYKQTQKQKSNLNPENKDQLEIGIASESIPTQGLQLQKAKTFIDSIETDVTEDESNRIKEDLKQVPDSYLQTMAWNLQQNHVFTKLKTVVSGQLDYLKRLLTDLKKCHLSHQLISKAQEQLADPKLDDRLKAWVLTKVRKNCERVEKIVEFHLHSLQFNQKLASSENATNWPDLIAAHAQQLEEIAQGFECQKSLKYFKAENKGELFGFLLFFERAYSETQNTLILLKKENHFCTHLVKQFQATQAILSQIVAKHGQVDDNYKQTLEAMHIDQKLQSQDLLAITNQFLLLDKLHPTPTLKQQIMDYSFKMEKYKQKLLQHSQCSEYLNRLVILREQQYHALLYMLNSLMAEKKVRYQRIVQLFYVKEAKLYQRFPSNYGHLNQLIRRFSELQKGLALQKKFISSINLNLQSLANLNKEETMIVHQKAVCQKQEATKTQTHYPEKQKDYIKTLEARNERLSNSIKKISIKGKVKEEYENEVFRWINRLKQSDRQKAANVQCIRQIPEVITQEKVKCRHIDIVGQMIWILEDLKAGLLRKEVDSSLTEIQELCKKVMFKNGLPKCWDVEGFVKVENAVFQIFEGLSKSLAEYFSDEALASYLQSSSSEETFKKAKAIDLLIYQFEQSMALLKLKWYYDQFDANWAIEVHFDDWLSCDLEVVKEFLIQKQKAFEEVYYRFQKNSDATLAKANSQQRFLHFKLKSSTSKRDDFAFSIRQLNHCLLLRFDAARILIHKWAKHFFYHKRIASYSDKQVQSKVQKLVASILQKKAKYYPNLANEICSQISSLHSLMRSYFQKRETLIYLQLINVENNAEERARMLHELTQMQSSFSQEILDALELIRRSPERYSFQIQENISKCLQRNQQSERQAFQGYRVCVVLKGVVEQVDVQTVDPSCSLRLHTDNLNEDVELLIFKEKEEAYLNLHISQESARVIAFGLSEKVKIQQVKIDDEVLAIQPVSRAACVRFRQLIVQSQRKRVIVREVANLNEF